MERMPAAFGEQNFVPVSFENSLVELPGPEVIVYTKQLRGRACC
jgi:hypothetical protein